MNHTVENGRGRVGQGRVVVVERSCVLGPVLLHLLVEVLDLVLAQGSITLNRQQFADVPASTQFDTGTIRLGNVGGQFLTDIAQLARLYQLVLEVHIVERGIEIEVGSFIAITQFIVNHLLSLGIRIFVVVREVVALRLTMTDGHSGIGGVTVHIDELLEWAVVPLDTHLGVHEVVLLVDVQRLVVPQAVGTLYKTVVDTVGLVVHTTVLHVARQIPFISSPVVGQLIVAFHVDAAIKLLRVRIVVFVVAIGQILRAQRLVLDVGDIAEVVAVELLYREAAHHVPATVVVAQVAHQSVGILLQSLLAHEVGLGVGAQSELLASLLMVAELVIVAIAVGIVERC